MFFLFCCGGRPLLRVAGAHNTIKKTKNSLFFHSKSAVLQKEHCTFSAPKGALLWDLVCCPRIPTWRGALKVQCSFWSTKSAVLLGSLFCFFSAGICYASCPMLACLQASQPAATRAKMKRRGKNQHHKKLHSLLGDARAAAKEVGQS